MKRVFISYRHVKPDEDLAKIVCEHLRTCGYIVFIDADIAVGQDWVKWNEDALLKCHYLVVFLSAESIVSNMVRHEVEVAHKHQKHILPIRIGFEGELPYDLGAYIHRSQYLSWKPEMPGHELAARIGDALPIVRPPGRMQAPEISYAGETQLRAADQLGIPLPVADPRLVASLESGALQLSSPFYVRRPADTVAEKCLDSAEGTTIVRGPRQMGKSSLLARLHARAQTLGRKSYYVDFQLMDRNHLIDLDGLFRHLARQIQRTLGTAIDPRKVWDDSDGPKANMTYYLEDAVLASAEAPVHVIFDEAERLFELPYRDDFFSTVRGWHNLRATNPRFGRLCVIIGHAETPSRWIQDIHQSPFNVGQSIAIDGFELAEVAELNRRYGSPIANGNGLSWLLDFLGGHPYLTRLALHTLATRGCSFSELTGSLDDQSGPFADHLRGVIWTLGRTPEIRESFRQILLGRSCEDEMHYQCLWAVGLISGKNRMGARARCRLYQQFFERHL
jgi:hypothetical protein